MSHPERVFRLFISSTFDDLKVERNALDAEVFPKIAALCESRNFSFQPIDLRWGVSQEAALDHQAIDTCLEEIARCQSITPRPNFLILLGDRYGWQPLPTDLSVEERSAIVSTISPADRELLEQWYLLDRNGLPPRYYLRARRVGTSEASSDWTAIEDDLRRIILAAPLSSALRERACASATELEIVRGLFEAPRAKEHVACFVREIEDPGRTPDFVEGDVQRSARLENLKIRLRHTLGPNYRRYGVKWSGNGADPAYLPQLLGDVRNHLEQIVEAEMTRISGLDSFVAEADLHRSFAGTSDAGMFVGREAVLRETASHLNGDDPCPLVIAGDPGSGRTATMIRVFHEATETMPGARLVIRFIGLTPRSSAERSLLEGLCTEIAGMAGQPGPLPRDLAGLEERFTELLATASADSPIVVLLDGLDQLADQSPDTGWHWIPRALPDHARVVASGLSGQAGPFREVSLPRLEDEACSLLLSGWLTAAHRTLQPEQRRLVEASSNGNALALRIGFEQARHWRSADRFDDVGHGLEGMIDHLLASLEAASKNGVPLMRRCLGLLFCSRFGLAEKDLLELLSVTDVLKDLGQRSDPQSPPVTRLPAAIWARLHAGLAPFLSERLLAERKVFAFRNVAVKRFVERRYVACADTARVYHRALASHFEALADPTRDGTWTGGGEAAFRDLPFHLYMEDELAGADERIRALARDQNFWKAQFRATRDVSAVVELQDFAIRRAAATGDTLATILATSDHQQLRGLLQRTFGFQFVRHAKADPALGLTLARSLSRAANRTVALTVVAWLAAPAPEHAAFCRRVLREIASGEGPVSVHHVCFVLPLMRDLVSLGFAGAADLARLIPDCPARRAAARAWENAGAPLHSVSAALRLPALVTASDFELENVRTVTKYIYAEWDSGAINQTPAKVEETLARRFGFDAVEIGEVALAAKFLVIGDLEGAALMVNRGLYVAHAAESVAKKPRMRLALVDALIVAGERDLAAEVRAQIVSSTGSLLKFSPAPSTAKRMAPHVLDIAAVSERTFPWTLAESANMGDVLQKARKSIDELAANSPARRDWDLHRAAQSCHTRAFDDAGAIVQGIAENVELESAAPALLLALGALAEICGREVVRVAAYTALANRGLPEDLTGAEGTRLFDCLVTATPAEVEAAALACRVKQRPDVLFALVAHLSAHGAGTDAVDAAVAQLILAEASGAERVREIAVTVMKEDRDFGVAQYLGFYYFHDVWQLLAGVGLAFIALGSANRTEWRVALAVAGFGALGALLDLVTWHRAGFWKRPEISRRTGFIAGSLFMLWALLFHLQDELPRLMRPAAIGYGFLSAWAAFIGIGAALAWAFYQWGLSRRFSVPRLVALLLFAFAAVPASAWLGARIGSDWLTGFLLGGSALLAVGLNFLIKSIPVRRMYARQGIRMRVEAPPEGPLATDVAWADDWKSNAAHDKVILAQQQRSRGRLDLAYRLYCEAADHPERARLSPTRQSAILLMKGFLARALGRPHEAIEDYRLAADLNPRSPDAHLNAALIFAQELHDPERSLLAFNESIALDPVNPEAYSSRGLVKQDLGMLDGAMEDFDLALSLDPDHANALVNKGNAFLRRREYGEALRLYDRALQIDPSDRPLRQVRDRLRRAGW